MKTVTARFAVLDQYLSTQISADGHRLVGFHFASVFNDIMDGGHMNLTLTSISNDIGSCNDTSYSGAYSVLYNNKSDVSLFMASNSACDRMSPFEAGFLFMDWPSSILMMKDLIPKSRTSSPSLLTTAPLSIFLLLVTLSFLIHQCITRLRSPQRTLRILYRFVSMRKRRRNPGYKMFWLMVAVTFRQSRLLRARSCRIRFLFILFCWMIMTSSIFWSSFFKTSLVIKQPVEHIENLIDLARSDRYTGLFLKEWNLYRWFSVVKDPVMENVWRKATGNTGSTSAALLSRVDMYGAMQRLGKGRVLLSPVTINTFLRDAYCYVYDEAEEISSIIHISKTSFFPFLSMAIFRRGAAQEIKDRINWIFMNYNEHGLHDFYKKNPLGILRKTPVQRTCYQKMESEEREQGSEEFVSPIIRDNLTGLAYSCIISMAIASLVLLIEALRKRQIRKHFTFLIR